MSGNFNAGCRWNVHARNVKLFGNDERFKENITNANVETCLFNINKIRVVNYQLSKRMFFNYFGEFMWIKLDNEKYNNQTISLDAINNFSFFLIF